VNEIAVSCRRPTAVFRDGHPSYVVERFRYVDSAWITTRTQVQALTAADDLDPFYAGVFDGPPPVRWKLDLTCPRCQLTAPMRMERLTIVLTLLSQHGRTSIELSELQQALDQLAYKRSRSRERR